MNEVLMAAFVAASIIALFFYMENKAARRETTGLMRTIAFYEKTITEEEDEINDSDEDNAEQSRRSQNMLGIILKNTEFLMSSFDDLKAAQAVTDAKIAAVAVDVTTLLAKLAAIPVAGMTPEQQAALDEAVTHANAMNASLSAADAAANPPAPTPPIPDVPATDPVLPSA